MKIKSCFIFILVAALMFFPTKVDARAFCSGHPSLEPKNWDSPDPQKTIYPNPSSLGYDCDVPEIKRVISTPTPTITWSPQIVNFGLLDHYDESYDLTYRVALYKVNKANKNQCYNSWWDVFFIRDTDSQSFIKTYGTRNTTIPARAGIRKWCDINWWWPWCLPYFTGALPDVPAHEITETFKLEKANGSPLDNGWYQVDIQQSCDGGSSWVSNREDMLAGTFIRVGCDVPGAPEAVEANTPFDVNVKDRLNLNWSHPTPPGSAPKSDVVNYKIWRKNGLTGLYDILAGTVNGDVANYTDTGLLCGTEYFYKVQSIGCNSGTYSTMASAFTNSCPAVSCIIYPIINSAPATQDPACINSNESKRFSVIGNVLNPVASGYWSASFPSAIVSHSKPISPLINNLEDFNIGVSSTQSGSILFNDGATNCIKNVVAFPRRTANAILQQVTDCATLATPIGIPGKTVTYLPPTGPAITGTTVDTGAATLSNLPFVDTSSNSCAPLNYTFSLAQSELNAYQFCSSESPGWNSVGPVYEYNFTGTSSSNSTITMPSIYFVPITSVTKWVNIKQGNYAVVESSLTMDGKTGSVAIEKDGTVYSDSNLNMSLANGDVGPTDTAINRVYKFEQYSMDNHTEAVDLMLALDLSRPEIVTGDCNSGTTNTTETIFSCTGGFNINTSNLANIPSNIRLVIVREGDVNVAADVNLLNFALVTGDNMTVLASTTRLEVGGYLWVKGTIDTDREIYVNSNFEYINNAILRQLLPSGRSYWVEFD